ncbi:hypothetical protein [Marinomonas polaris]|nr:hypothetical protein [Marinomonas polaris]
MTKRDVLYSKLFHLGICFACPVSQAQRVSANPNQGEWNVAQRGFNMSD